jgi:ketosteroid isomerase-like protein
MQPFADRASQASALRLQIRRTIMNYRLFRVWILTAMCVAALASSAAPGAAAAADQRDPLVAMFVWWNSAYKQKDGFTAEAFSRYFTKDAVMRINGKDRSTGVEDLAKHFRDIQARTEMVEIDLPFLDEFTSPSGDRIFTHHFVRARENGKDSRERVMGFAAIKDGKISLINFVSVPDPPGDAGGNKK